MGGLENSPITGRAIVRTEYNQWGDIIRETSLDVDGNPVNRRHEGWHYIVITYKKPGTELARHYYDKNDREVKAPQQ